jgi:hypothetical protein
MKIPYRMKAKFLIKSISVMHTQFNTNLENLYKSLQIYKM